MKKWIFLGMLLAGASGLWAQVPTDGIKVDSAKIWFDRGVQGIFNHDKVEYQLECYTNALRLDPKMSDAYRYRAADYFKLNKFQECVNDCNHYFELEKTHKKASKYVLATMHFRRAEALAMLSKYKEAKLDYDKAAEYVPAMEKYVEAQQRNAKLLGKH